MASAIEQQLYHAAQNNNVATLRTLLASDEFKRELVGKTQWTYNSGAPLHWAAYWGRDEMIRLMVEEGGIDVDSFALNGNFRFTSLQFAVVCNKPASIRLLLDLGADETLHGNYDANLVGTALDMAVKANSDDCADILRKYQGAEGSGGVPRAHLRSMIEKLNSRVEREEALAKGRKIQNDIKNKETEIKKITEDIAALKSDKDFRTDGQLKRMQNELDQIKELSEAFKKNSGSNNDTAGDHGKATDTKACCPVCLEIPAKIFSCGNVNDDDDDDNGDSCSAWFCTACRKAMKGCPLCRAEFNAVPPMRNVPLEKLMLGKM